MNDCYVRFRCILDYIMLILFVGSISYQILDASNMVADEGREGEGKHLNETIAKC